ncbi:MAG TPA: hypothetical protein VKB93_03750 [Thermoanaerobaculia bacterium]|nr:hypothetical protein [Thermoanaerobaculia bacterium]
MSEDQGLARTRLQQFLRQRGIPSARVEAKLRERMGAAAPSRRQVERWRLAKVDIRRKDMVRILWGVREAASDPDIQVHDLFDLDPNNPDNWMD